MYYSVDANDALHLTALSTEAVYDLVCLPRYNVMLLQSYTTKIVYLCLDLDGDDSRFYPHHI